jgi:hypothetical protein
VGHRGKWTRIQLSSSAISCFFYPAPPIIEVPSAQGGATGLLTEKSFELFWVDLEACANCLRRCMEAILDDWYAPSILNGRRAPLPWRIQQFSSQADAIPNVGHVAQSFRNLKIIGDIGSHCDVDEITLQSMLDAYDVFEDCFRHLYGEDEKERIEQVRTRLAELRNDNSRGA